LVSRDYFKALGIRIKEGRTFNEHDRAGQPGVLVISESLAKRAFPGRGPVKECSRCGASSVIKAKYGATSAHSASLTSVG
jgi:hypothetical protein